MTNGKSTGDGPMWEPGSTRKRDARQAAQMAEARLGPPRRHHKSGRMNQDHDWADRWENEGGALCETERQHPGDT